MKYKDKWEQLTDEEKENVRQVYNETDATNPDIDKCNYVEDLDWYFEQDSEIFEFEVEE